MHFHAVLTNKYCVGPTPQIRNPKGPESEPPKAFTFDQVYDWNCTQQEIFDITARPIVDACMEGFNGASLQQPCRNVRHA